MKIALVSDAWLPQNNGVVRTLQTTVRTLRELGHEVDVIDPSAFATFACPTYPEIRLAWRPRRELVARLERLDPDAVHAATEGPLGHCARRFCRTSPRASRSRVAPSRDRAASSRVTRLCCGWAPRARGRRS